MTLGSALQIGRTSLLSHQAAIEVAGNNLANVATEGYHRQRIDLVPIGDNNIGNGLFVGRGVQIGEISRAIDTALEGRLRSSFSEQQASIVSRDILAQIQDLQNEFSDIDLSSQLSTFFNTWSELANTPNDLSQRNIVIQQAKSLANYVNDLGEGLRTIRDQVDSAIGLDAQAVDDLLTQIESLNQSITLAEGGQGESHSLRDQRDQLINELSEYIDVSTLELPSGAVDVFVGSTPIVLNGRSRGIDVRTESVDGELQIEVVVRADQTVLDASSGALGARIAARYGTVTDAIDTLNSFANNLIFEVNRLHTQGQGIEGYQSLTSTEAVDDSTLALTDPDAGLNFTPTHGSFEISVTQLSSGLRSTTSIDVDLDGIGADTSLDDLAAAINAVGNISASVTAGGQLRIQAATGDFEVSFGNDTSGVLAALGVGTFFTGSRASDIGVNAAIDENPALLAATQDHQAGGNTNAVAIAGLRDQPLDALGGLSLTQTWSRHVENFAIRLGQAQQQVDADTLVYENLQAQQQSVSGVNADEEAINLLAYQRAYQGSARFLTVVDELMQTLLQLV